MFADYHNKINNSIQFFLDELNDSKIYDPIKYFLKLFKIDIGTTVIRDTKKKR